MGSLNNPLVRARSPILRQEKGVLLDDEPGGNTGNRCAKHASAKAPSLQLPAPDLERCGEIREIPPRCKPLRPVWGHRLSGRARTDASPFLVMTYGLPFVEAIRRLFRSFPKISRVQMDSSQPSRVTHSTCTTRWRLPDGEILRKWRMNPPCARA